MWRSVCLGYLLAGAVFCYDASALLGVASVHVDSGPGTSVSCVPGAAADAWLVEHVAANIRHAGGLWWLETGNGAIIYDAETGAVSLGLPGHGLIDIGWANAWVDEAAQVVHVTIVPAQQSARTASVVTGTVPIAPAGGESGIIEAGAGTTVAIIAVVVIIVVVAAWYTYKYLKEAAQGWGKWLEEDEQ